MINLPVPLNKVMQSGDLKGIKPFAVLYRNKWYAEESASGYEESDSGSDLGGHFALDMANPIDISSMIVKPNTLSMTLDVNEIAQYKANNVTLTLSDPFNRFIEGTPQSYFPAGYQLYGSQVVLYYGLDETNRTPLFVGVIKDLPTHKPEQYQVDLKLISPLELLSDIEAKEFSDKYYGEELHYEHQDDEQHRIYSTANTGVGGFYAVYADGNKMFEGVDYEVSQTNELSLPALVTIINADLHSATITADYYCWKTGLTVEQIVSGLVAVAGYINNTDIRSVAWNILVRGQRPLTQASFTLAYRNNGSGNYVYSGNSAFSGGPITDSSGHLRYSQFPTNFEITLILGGGSLNYRGDYYIGDFDANNILYNGYCLTLVYTAMLSPQFRYYIYKYTQGQYTQIGYIEHSGAIKIKKQNNNIIFSIGNDSVTDIVNFTGTGTYNEKVSSPNLNYVFLDNTTLEDLDSGILLNNAGIGFEPMRRITVNDIWVSLIADFTNANSNYSAGYRTTDDLISWSNLSQIQLGAEIGERSEYIQFYIDITTIDQITDILNCATEVISNNLVLRFVNLSNKTVLEALQDFALISGYEFGVDRQGTFFFRPRSQSTTPIYDLDSNEIVKIDNINKKFNDFFTKLTLTFAQVPLEFYANEGTRPTPIDKYGVINKEIDKPDIVNYDNPELAQAIGPQLLAIYSNLADIIQLTGKLNLSLELGDIVNVKRNYNLTAPESASDYDKFICQNTYYQAAKITGLNYNFDKRQITYTLRNVSNSNNQPQPPVSSNQFPYDLPINF